MYASGIVSSLRAAAVATGASDTTSAAARLARRKDTKPVSRRGGRLTIRHSSSAWRSALVEHAAAAVEDQAHGKRAEGEDHDDHADDLDGAQVPSFAAHAAQPTT